MTKKYSDDTAIPLRTLLQMAIRFSTQEIEELRSYFNKIDSGQTQKQLGGLCQDFPEWNTVFLLLRKLLAYGVHYTVETDPGKSYESLQTESQKADTMLLTVHKHVGIFKNLLATYIANQ